MKKKEADIKQAWTEIKPLRELFQAWPDDGPVLLGNGLTR